MKMLLGFGAVLLTVGGLLTMPGEAHDVATRCTAYGCSQIVCNRTGDRCRRYDEVRDERYETREYDRRYDRDYRLGDEQRWRRNCDPDNPTCRRDWSDEGRWWDQ